jgi:DNA modification methylase
MIARRRWAVTTRSAVHAGAAQLRIEYIAPERLRADPRNARIHSMRQVKLLAKSIDTFGFVAPALIDACDNILAGHARVEAAKRCGLDLIPAVRLDHLTLAQAQALKIADNRLAELARWDENALRDIFIELSVQDLKFDIEATGFTVGEIDLTIEGLSPPESDDPADAMESVVEGPAVTQPGDIYRLDGHRLLCGDARDPGAFRALMGEARASVTFADPPYNVRIAGHVTSRRRSRHREFKMASGEMTEAEFIDFLEAFLRQTMRFSVAGAIISACMDWAHIYELLAAARICNLKLHNICVWSKPNAGLGSLYRSRHELISVLRNGAGHRNNVQLGRFGRNRSNVWEYASPSAFGRAGEEGKLAELHPTVKPVRLIADALLDVSARGDIVLDPFLGSGSTLIAAQRVGRVCHGIELDPRYVDVAIRRWQADTGGRAVLAATGERFDDVAKRMEGAR